jgi:hypothetical protein
MKANLGNLLALNITFLLLGNMGGELGAQSLSKPVETPIPYLEFKSFKDSVAAKTKIFEGSLNSLQMDRSAQNKRITDLEAAMVALQGNKASLEKRISDLEGAWTALQGMGKSLFPDANMPAVGSLYLPFGNGDHVTIINQPVYDAWRILFIKESNGEKFSIDRVAYTDVLGINFLKDVYVIVTRQDLQSKKTEVGFYALKGDRKLMPLKVLDGLLGLESVVRGVSKLGAENLRITLGDGTKNNVIYYPYE